MSSPGQPSATKREYAVLEAGCRDHGAVDKARADAITVLH